MLLAGLLWGSNQARADEAPTGADLLPIFRQAARGGPLRCAAIGGSVTQAGKGWIGPWLREQFPNSPITIINAGMSATGSALGVFRIERDVITAQTDLLLLEFAVNDSGEPDEQTIRNVESIVVRLKSLPDPPAIVFVECATRSGINLARHRKIADHYNLLEVNLQQSVDDYLKQNNLPWSALFDDDVHANDRGHAFYGQMIAKALQPYVDRAKKSLADAAPGSKPPDAAPAQLPRQLSTLPLLLDGRLISLRNSAGWDEETSVPVWWNMFFLGLARSDKPGEVLKFPFRGTTIGLLFALSPKFGTFYASVDGGTPVEVITNNREGYTYQIFDSNLASGEHVLTVVLPKSLPGPVKLGYALVAGETGSPRTLAPQGPFSADVLRQLEFRTIPQHDWKWIGPLGDKARTGSGTTADFETAWISEDQPISAQILQQSVAGTAGKILNWHSLSGDESIIDLARLAGGNNRGVSYLAGEIQAEKAGRYFLRFTVDYYAKVWINGQLVRTIDAGHGPVQSPLLIPVDLRPGRNQVLLKIQAGNGGNAFSFAVQTLPLNLTQETTEKGKQEN